MAFFTLPDSAKVNRVIPKNAFDEYTNTNQKKLFTDIIHRITWTHKLSKETINIEGKDIHEIQLFKIELKQNKPVGKILHLIDKSIPYPIIFWVEVNDQAFLSASAKHKHPSNENIAIIDWTYTSTWFNSTDNKYKLRLAISLDSIFKDICVQITGNQNLGKHELTEISDQQKELKRLQSEIKKLKSAISKCKQFNEKVSLNLKLKELKNNIEQIRSIN